MAQIRHNPQNKKGLPEGRPLANAGAAGRNRTHDPLVRSYVIFPKPLIYNNFIFIKITHPAL